MLVIPLSMRIVKQRLSSQEPSAGLRVRVWASMVALRRRRRACVLGVYSASYYLDHHEQIERR